MPDKKLTDSEIVKALECCRQDDYDYCVECPYRKNKPCQENLIQDCFDLINRLQAENDNLRKEMEGWRNTAYHEASQCETAKAEAYKECIEKVKENSNKMELVCSGALVRTDYTITKEKLDNLLKEFERKEDTIYDD